MDILKDLFFMPVESWQEGDIFIALVGMFCFYAVPLMILAFFAFLAIDGLKARRTYPCQHCGAKTKGWKAHAAAAEAASCTRAQKCCKTCADAHEEKFTEQLQNSMKQEPIRNCPSCSTPMVKTLVGVATIIDTCNSCKGLFLDGGEREKLEAIARQQGYNSGYGQGRATGQAIGQSTGQMNGMAIGMTIGQMHQ